MGNSTGKYHGDAKKTQKKLIVTCGVLSAVLLMLIIVVACVWKGYKAPWRGILTLVNKNDPSRVGLTYGSDLFYCLFICLKNRNTAHADVAIA